MNATNVSNAIECLAALRRLRYAYGKYKEAIANQLRQSYIDGEGNIQCRSKEAETAVVLAAKRFASARKYFLDRRGECREEEEQPSE